MEEKKEMLEEKTLTRRSLLSGAGKIAVVGAGIAAVSGGLSLFSKAEAAKKASELPWPYKKLTEADMKKVGNIAHTNWPKHFCTYATLSGLVTVLREKVGGPWLSFPMDLADFAHGGTAGWGGTCGTLIGSGIVATLVAGPAVGEQIENEVIKYYSEESLPIFMPEHPIVELKAKSVSGAPICHISVGRFMKREGIAEGKGPEGIGFLSEQQIDRCARLAADMAIKTARLLNLYADGKFVAGTPPPLMTLKMHPTQSNCTDCHGENIPKAGPFGTGMETLKKLGGAH
ncbi:MAG: hypothetical protein COW90_02160 [Nitrospirae bacterium CG22_combo_CG10-13_8_21_14_all_44_11]|nr:MAG: hypothetical protein COW90_02160 [Nitrospirae bacterium CG22_combo_CG10-13_8_21_14_all_44_11]